MRAGASCRDELLTHLYREWQIRKPIAMQMPELASADAELDAAKAMRLDGYTVPIRDFALDLFGDAVGHLSNETRSDG